MLWYVYSNADFAVVGKLLGQTVLGYYSLAFQLMSLPVQKLTDNVNQVIYPVYCRLQGDRPRLRDSYLRLTVLLSVLGVPVLTGMALVAGDAFIVLLGTKWIEAVRPFQLLCLVGSIMVVMNSFPPLLNAPRPAGSERERLVRQRAAAAGGVRRGRILPGSGRNLFRVVGAVSAADRRLRALHTAYDRHHAIRAVSAQFPVVAAVLFMSLVVLAVQYGLGEGASIRVRLPLSIVVGMLAYIGFLFGFARQTVVALLFDFWREIRGREETATSAVAA